jgi:hypothetical protein
MMRVGAGDRTETTTVRAGDSSDTTAKRNNGVRRSSKRKTPSSTTGTEHIPQAEETKEDSVTQVPNAPPAISENETMLIAISETEAPEAGNVIPDKLGLTRTVMEQISALDKYRQESRGDTALTAEQYAKKLVPIYNTMQTELEVVAQRLAFFRVWLYALMMYVLGGSGFQKLVADGSIVDSSSHRDSEHLELWRWFIEHDLDVKVRKALTGRRNQLTLADIRHAHRIVSKDGKLYILPCLAVCFYILWLRLIKLLVILQ